MVAGVEEVSEFGPGRLRSRGGACLAACYAFVLERYGESRCVPRCASVHCDDEEL